MKRSRPSPRQDTAAAAASDVAKDDDDDDELLHVMETEIPPQKQSKKTAVKPSLPRLGATEFAAVLNSSSGGSSSTTTDYKALYRTLKNFVTIVRRERKIALEGYYSHVQGVGPNNNNDDRYETLMERSSGREEDESSNSDHDDDDDSDDDDEEEISKQGPSKRYKKEESWKQDTANYNVPFVGTSFSAVKGDTGTVVKGTWPTGLLEAYLKKSPLAIELTGDDNAFVPRVEYKGLSKLQKNFERKSSRKINPQEEQQLVQSIQKCYLQALVELVSAAVPFRRRLETNAEKQNSTNKQDDDDDDDNNNKQVQRFLPQLVKLRLPGLLHLLKEETGSGRGMAKIVGGCGPLAAPTLSILTALSQTTAVRQVSRALELGTVVNEQVLRFLLAPRRPGSSSSKIKNSSKATATEASSSSLKVIPRNEARAAALELAAALASNCHHDHTIVTSITSTGHKNKDRSNSSSSSSSSKVPCGILYLALREGLSMDESSRAMLSSSSSTNGDDSSSSSSSYWNAVAHLLQVVRQSYLLSDGDHKQPKSKRVVATTTTTATPRTLADLWTRDAMQSLCHLSTQYAPSIMSSDKLDDPNSFISVMNGTDSTYQHSNDGPRSAQQQTKAGVEARRLLFTLLANPQASPLLQDFSNTFLRTGCQQLVVRAMIQLFEGSGSTISATGSSSGCSVSVQNFLLHVLQTTPALLPMFFGELQFPTEKNALQVFPSIARWNFVSKILLKGPSAMAAYSSLTRTSPSSSSSSNSTTKNRRHRQSELLNCLFPANLKRQHLRKALLSSNAFLVAEVLKLVVAALRRFDPMVVELSSSSSSHQAAGRDEEAEFTALESAFCQVLPDVQCLRTVLQRYGRSREEERFNQVVMTRLCETFRLLAKVLPRAVVHAKLDWVRQILPHSSDNVTQFTRNSRLSFQYKVLGSLHAILVATKDATAFPAATSLQPILEIMIQTTNQRVMDKARQIALLLLHPRDRHHSTTNDKYCSESSSCLAYEATCWVDGLSLENMGEFVEVVQESTNIPLRGMVDVARAWSTAVGAASDEPLPVTATAISTILLTALVRIQRGLSSPTFRLLTLQVVAKCVLYYVDPRPLVALILYREEKSTENITGPPEELVTNATDERFLKLKAYAKSLLYFESLSSSKRQGLLDSVVETLFGPTWSIKKDNSIASLRFLAHRIMVSPSKMDEDRYFKLFRCKIVAIIKNSGSQEEVDDYMKRIYPRLRAFCSADFCPLDILLLTCGTGTMAKLPKNEMNTMAVYSALKKPNLMDGSSTGLRSSLLHHIVLGPFLPQSTLNECVACMLEAPRNQLATKTTVSWSSLCVALLKLAGKVDESCQKTDASFVDALWHAWSTLSLESEPDVLCHIQSLIAEAMSGDSGFMFALNASFELHPPRTVIQRAASIRAVSSTDYATDRCMVSAFIENDYIRFGPAFVGLLSDSVRDDSLHQQLIEGQLDTALLATLDRVYQSDDRENHDLQDSLAGLVLERASIAFARTASESQQGLDDVSMMLLKLKSDTLKRCCRKQVVQVANALYSSLSGVGTFVSLKLALHLQRAITSDVEDCLSTKELASAVLVRLTEATLRALQQARKKSKRGEPSLNPIEMSQLFCEFLNFIPRYDDDIDSEHVRSTTVSNLIRACLKLGMKQGVSDGTALPAACLHLVRILVSSSKAAGPLHFLAGDRKHTLANFAFDLCTSHSSFSSILNDDEKRESPLRLETVRLLLSCVSGNRDLKFDRPTWEILLSAYGGGMGIVDQTIRRLLFLYVPKTETSDAVCMHQMRWNVSSSRSQQAPWDWLASSFDMSRVYATLRRFPSEDPIEPEAIRDVEEWSDDEAERNATDIDELSIESESKDQRYSTGFVLPLILGALEFVCETLSSSDDEVQAGRGPVVVLAQRLCDVGALALALAGLCSTCSTVRKVSLSILYWMSKVIHSDDARQLASWRQRPQIAMIIDSVQRALTIRTAEVAFDSSSDEKLKPPQLPATVAIFLARAAFVLHRPGHFMYPSINRFFLRVDVDHGAFQDLNRLPGFISLFCSSADEGDQAQKEQTWAVETLRDSFIDGTCYKGVMACHAPELLLSTVDSLSCRPANVRGTESELLLGALLRIITRGGHRSTSHLIGRLGLLSWLQSFIVGQAVHTILPSLRSLVLFLRLMKETTQHAVGFLSTDDLRAACTGTGEAIITLVINCVEGGVAGDTRVDTLIEHSCEVFRVLRDSCGGWEQLTSDNLARPDGIVIESALRFLTVAGRFKQLPDALLSICSLPVCLESLSLKTAISFCTMILGILKNVQDPEEALLGAVFHRLHLILSASLSKPLDDRVLRASIQSHHKNCCRYSTVRDMWQKCLIHTSVGQRDSFVEPTMPSSTER